MKPDPSSIPLRDIHLPAAVSWWPPAIGWWLLLLLAIAAVFGWIWWRRRQRQRRWRVEALQALRAIEQAYQQHRDPVRMVNELSVWLRRVCVSVFPRQEIAAVTGQRWLEALDSVFTNAKTAPQWRFDSHLGRALLALPYQRTGAMQGEVDGDSLLRLCRAWLKNLPQPVQTPTGGFRAESLAGSGA